MNYNIPLGFDDPDPIGKIFKNCELTTTIEKFIQFLERMDRYDVVDDSKELIGKFLCSQIVILYFYLLDNFIIKLKLILYLIMFQASDIDYHKKHQYSVANPTSNALTNYSCNASTILTLGNV